MNDNMTSTATGQTFNGRQYESPTEAMLEYLQTYARERPEMVALWCFGIGFVLGWKLKPW